MIVTAYKTHAVGVGEDIYSLLDTYLPPLHEEDVVVITSKIISLCQHRVVPISPSIDKLDLIHQESEQYLDHVAQPRYGFVPTIVNSMIIANAGIDESNGNGQYILWPERLFDHTAEIWQYFRQKFSLSRLGVIVTDSHTTMLRWGVTGIGLSWAGFSPLYRYIDEPDIFGRKFHSVNVSTLDGLSAAAVQEMGEGAEQTPLAVISSAHNVQFVDHARTANEIDSLRISLADDLYAPLLTSVSWKKGGKAV